MEELIEKLLDRGCQVIDSSDELYKTLEALDSEDWIDLSESLDGAGFSITYNNVNDCFVIS